MSIAVMNWVWANSPTSGNERLVLLALADACSRDDGTGCWPSAATIARKANISDRTVRRVITRLEAENHLIVHRGGRRAVKRFPMQHPDGDLCLLTARDVVYDVDIVIIRVLPGCLHLPIFERDERASG